MSIFLNKPFFEIKLNRSVEQKLRTAQFLNDRGAHLHSRTARKNGLGSQFGMCSELPKSV